jgi:hypothetical protein
MKISWYTLTLSAAKRKLLPTLKGRVFHKTSTESFFKILKSGGVENNKNRQFKLNWDFHSYFRNRGCVSVCDFHNNKPTYRSSLWKYNIFPEGSKFAYLFLSPKYFNRLVTYQKSNDGRELTEAQVVVPGLESGFSDRIDLKQIEEIFLIHIVEGKLSPEVQFVKRLTAERKMQI